MPYTNQQYTSTWQARLDNVSDLTIRKRPLLSMMSNRGRITGPNGGTFVEWPLFVQAKTPHPFDRSTPPTYVAPDNLRMPRLEWSAYQYGEQLHILDLEQNMGRERFIDLMENAEKSVDKAFSDEWPDLFYQDGSTAAGTSPLYGLKSALRYYSAATATAAAPRQGYEGKVRLPNGTYAGYDTTLGANGGNWAGDNASTSYVSTASGTPTFLWWPEGKGDGKYDMWSPMVINTTSQAWGTSPTASFNETYCEDMIDFGVDYTSRLNTATNIRGSIDLVLWNTKQKNIWRKRFSSTNRVIVESAMIPADGSVGSPSTSGWETGKKFIYHNGCFLIDDFGIGDSNLTIGLNLDAIEYRTVHSKTGTGRTRLMSPYRAEIPGGAGYMIGGRSHGQFIINCPRKLVFWYPLGNYTT